MSVRRGCRPGLRAAGFGLGGAVAFGVGVSVLWGASALVTGRRYEGMRAGLSRVTYFQS